ncbi:MAG: hypothetical protein ACLRWF_02475 [Ruthenibacterium sp.]
MLFVKQIRLPLSAPRDAALAPGAARAGGKAQRGAPGRGFESSVDARRGRPSLVYTMAVELWDEGAEFSYEGFAPSVSLARPPAVHHPARRRAAGRKAGGAGLGPRGCLRRWCWRRRALPPCAGARPRQCAPRR